MSDATASKSVEWLQVELESGGGASLLLLDCRTHELYESSHIESAINLAIPGLMLRRFKKGNIPIRTIIPNHEDKEKFVRRCQTDTVVLYDECTADWRDCGGAPASVLGLILHKLWEDGCKAFYLDGESPCRPKERKKGDSNVDSCPLNVFQRIWDVTSENVTFFWVMLLGCARRAPGGTECPPLKKSLFFVG